MPSDSADFGRMKTFYGKVYTALRAGVDDAYVAGLMVKGVGREIRRHGGMPVYDPAISLVALCIRRPDMIRAQIEFGCATFQDSTLALLRRHVAEWQAFAAPLRGSATALTS